MDRKAFRFFFENAGHVVGNRALCAAALARAEQLVSGSTGYRFRWEDDTDADWSWMSEKESSRPHVVEGCILERRCSECGALEHVGSLWGIFDADESYRRVVQAELACEASA